MEMVGEILRPDLSVANLVSQDLVSLSPTDTRKHTCKLSSSRFHVEKEENERERERERRERERRERERERGERERLQSGFTHTT